MKFISIASLFITLLLASAGEATISTPKSPTVISGYCRVPWGKNASFNLFHGEYSSGKEIVYVSKSVNKCAKGYYCHQVEKTTVLIYQSLKRGEVASLCTKKGGTMIGFESIQFPVNPPGYPDRPHFEGTN